MIFTSFFHLISKTTFPIALTVHFNPIRLELPPFIKATERAEGIPFTGPGQRLEFMIHHPDGGFEGSVIQQGGGMGQGEDLLIRKQEEFSVKVFEIGPGLMAGGMITLQDVARHMVSQWNQDVGPDDCDLLGHVTAACVNFILFGPPVSGEMAFHQIGHINIISFQPGRLKEFIDEGTRRTDKHPALFVFLFSRSQSNKHQSTRCTALTG